MTDVVLDVAELAKKSSVAWIEAHGRLWPIWHEWIEAAEASGGLCLVGSVRGSSEQPIPDVVDGEQVTLFLRSKSDRSLAGKVIARVEIIGPDSAAWEPTTAILKASRLNLNDSADAIDRWARECRVLRLVATGDHTQAADLPTDREATRPLLS